MIEILKTLRDTPLPSILVIGGLVFLLLPFLKKTGGAVELETSNKGVAALIGVILLTSGIGLYLLPISSFNSATSSTVPEPAITIRPTETRSALAVIPTATIKPVPTQVKIYPTNQATSGYIPTCNWELDWKLQSDGSYVWVGLPPGSPGCELVGQYGELFQRLVKGENIRLVVNIGDRFVGLNICKGKFTATEVIPGQTCVPYNPELWPQVKGVLVVTESDGFSVGIKK